MLAYAITIGLITIFVTLSIRAEFAENRKQIYIFKPLSTLLVVFVALLSILIPTAHSSHYSMAILLALILSLGGDIALMFNAKQAFIIGLILFLLAHVVYSILFTIYNGFQPEDYLIAVILFLLAVVVYAYLYSGLDNLKIPVLFYILIISFMMNRAISTFWGDYFNQFQAFLISLGAGLFYISDLLLAINKFKKPFKYNRFGLAFYYAGQLLLALSTIQ